MSEDRACTRCGAVLGPGEITFCGSACLELSRREIPAGSEVRRRERTQLHEAGPLQVALTTSEIR
jgi:hypothetical protein